MEKEYTVNNYNWENFVEEYNNLWVFIHSLLRLI